MAEGAIRVAGEGPRKPPQPDDKETCVLDEGGAATACHGPADAGCGYLGEVFGLDLLALQVTLLHEEGIVAQNGLDFLQLMLIAGGKDNPTRRRSRACSYISLPPFATGTL